MKNLYDINKIPIFVGDVLKISHYTNSRRKKEFMYKWVIERKLVRNKLLFFEFFIISHLQTPNLNDSKHIYRVVIDDSIYEGCEIIQGYGVDGENYFKERLQISKNKK